MLCKTNTLFDQSSESSDQIDIDLESSFVETFYVISLVITIANLLAMSSDLQ
jgi:hypothetical protein